MKNIYSTLWIAVLMALMLVVMAAPAFAHDFGPLVFCDQGTLTNCTNHADPAFPGDTFSCEGAMGGVVSCTSQVSGDNSPYCSYLGNEASSNNRDVYMCGPQSEFSSQTKDEYWQQMKAAQSQGVYP